MSERLTDDFEIIENYLDGKLSKKEKAEFEDRLLLEPKLKTQYDFYVALVEGVKEARKNELRHYILEHAEPIPPGRSWFFGILPYLLTFLLIFGVVYFITETYIPEYRIPRVIGKVDSLIQIPIDAIRNAKENKESKEQINTPELTTEKKTGEISESQGESGTEMSLEENTPETGGTEEEIISVKEDELLHDTLLFAGLWHTDADSHDSLLQSSSESKGIYVEFWRSPVNYKGYKFNGKKLLLFGIHAPFSVSLLSQEENMYLLHEKKYFYLEKDGSFHNYQALSELPH